MSLTIELKPETEQILTEQAEQKGLKIETYIEVLIEENVNGKRENGAEKKHSQETATVDERLAKLNKLFDSLKDKNYPHIPDEALRRENIY